MTAAIAKLSGSEAYDLIFAEHLAKLDATNREIMRQAMATSSRVWLGYEGERVLCCWGLQPPSLLADRAHLWLYTTEHLREHVFVFIRHSQRAVEEMLEHYPILFGVTEIGNDRAIRWLRWLGAVYSEPQGQALPFEIRRSNG